MAKLAGVGHSGRASVVLWAQKGCGSQRKGKGIVVVLTRLGIWVESWYSNADGGIRAATRWS